MRYALAIMALALTVTTADAQRRAAPDTGPRNPFADNQAAIDEGRSLFNSTCTGCHGANGAAGEFGPGLAIPGRSYARTTDSQIFDAIKNGIAGTPMPAHAGKLNDDQVWKVAAYVKGLRGTAIDAPSPGDVTAGEAVFRGKGQCSSCHMVKGQGSIVGPDLTNLASLRKTNSIIDALTKEQHRVYGPGGAQPHLLTPLPVWRVVRVTGADGKTVRGLLRNEDSFSLQVMGLDQQLHLYDRSKVKVVYEPKGLMPSDYDKKLSKDEFDNLLAYLTRLGTPPQPASAAVKMPGGPERD
ncbi:MAG TPA: c-type cytochrome [Rhizomicrobium sp.]|nr:c-type cytochrome [Rhizomicrobium sp.]